VGPSEKSLNNDEKILHVLNRLAFGPRPGDVEAVRSMGLDRWIDAQLHPDSIDDTAAQDKLANLTSLILPSEQLADLYKNDLKKNLKALQAQQAAKNAGNAAGTGQTAGN